MTSVSDIHLCTFILQIIFK